MIDISFFTTSAGELVGFRVKGHAGTGPKGSDIVCAAVSSAAYMVANTITEVIHAQANAFVDELSGMDLRVAAKDIGRCRDILSGFKVHAIALGEQYPKNITVNYMEV